MIDYTITMSRKKKAGPRTYGYTTSVWTPEHGVRVTELYDSVEPPPSPDEDCKKCHRIKRHGDFVLRLCDYHGTLLRKKLPRPALSEVAWFDLIGFLRAIGT